MRDFKSTEHYVVSLNGLDPNAIGQVVVKLTDRILVSGLNQSEFDRGDWWQRLFKSL